MAIKSVVLLLLTAQIVHTGRRFRMGCQCGLRKISKEEEVDCEESARIEAPQAQGSSNIIRFFFKILIKWIWNRLPKIMPVDPHSNTRTRRTSGKTSHTFTQRVNSLYSYFADQFSQVLAITSHLTKHLSIFNYQTFYLLFLASVIWRALKTYRVSKIYKGWPLTPETSSQVILV